MRPSARVDGSRLWTRLMDLAQFGAREDGGVDRQTMTDPEIAAHARIVSWRRSLGLSPYTDAAANLFLRFEGSDPALPPVLAGSHIDSQPTGGKFDGAYGVLAAVEAVEAMRDAGLSPRRAIEIVAWTNEEGSRFSPGMTGSDLFTGIRTLDGIAHQDIYSAAGHDARQLHYVCPAGMIFVPCRDGVSHNPAEWAEPSDLTAGARVLADPSGIWPTSRDRTTHSTPIRHAACPGFT